MAARSRAVAQDMVCDYITGLAGAASANALQRSGVAKLGTEDVLAVIRKEPARLARAKELIQAHEDYRRIAKEVQPEEKDVAATFG